MLAGCLFLVVVVADAVILQLPRGFWFGIFGGCGYFLLGFFGCCAGLNTRGGLLEFSNLAFGFPGEFVVG